MISGCSNQLQHQVKADFGTLRSGKVRKRIPSMRKLQVDLASSRKVFPDSSGFSSARPISK